MHITSIKAQLKNTERVSIYIDGAYSFSLAQSQLLEERLHVGLEIDEPRLVALKRASDFGKIFERILAYVLLRPRSQYEVVQYCRRKQFNPEDCDAIMAKMAARGYLDDRAFARSWLESRRLTKNFSIKRLRLELRQKGVDAVIIDEVLSAGGYDERAALRQLITKKQRLTRFQADPQKLVAYLARQGFAYDDIVEALKS